MCTHCLSSWILIFLIPWGRLPFFKALLGWSSRASINPQLCSSVMERMMAAEPQIFSTNHFGTNVCLNKVVNASTATMSVQGGAWPCTLDIWRPHRLLYLSGASGSRSITYFPLATDMIGTCDCQYILTTHRQNRKRLFVILTPGTFRILLFRSRSFVATI